MALTRDFKETVKARLKRDLKFRTALAAETCATRDKKLKQALLVYLRHPEVRAKRASKGDGR